MIIHRYTREQIQREFTHYGLMYGIIPVYVDMRNSDAPLVVTRNWIPEWTMPVGDAVFDLAVRTMQIMDPDYEPEFFIRLTGEVR